MLLTLNLARIPLSVFAFLGGALAIGVGFGTQTIIKNFISGMILLVERRVQIGDTIEIDGVSGAVTAVDLRSSTVRSGDGQDTLVPNSVLLEHKVTNWTLYDRKVRRSVQSGRGVRHADARRRGDDRGLREAPRQRARQSRTAGAVRGLRRQRADADALLLGRALGQR